MIRCVCNTKSLRKSYNWYFQLYGFPRGLGLEVDTNNGFMANQLPTAYRKTDSGDR